MDSSLSKIVNSRSPEDVPEAQAYKKQKVSQKIVITVKMEENENGKQKSDGQHSDCWSWRKYGQKPIKGSPYPRGYYKCSTSKGCSAKKQVERCKTDASLLIITYTSTHNHPSPKKESKHEQGPKQETPKIQTNEDNTLTVSKEDSKEEEEEKDQENGTSTEFHYYQSPFHGSDNQDMIINIKLEEESSYTTQNIESVAFDEKEKPLSYPHLMTFSTPKSEENDFYDELGELPISASSSSSFTRFMMSNFFEDRILINLP